MKTANCVELHSTKELEKLKLTFCCNASRLLPMLKKLESLDASCEMFALASESRGPGSAHNVGKNPVSSMQVIFNATDPTQLKELLVIEI